jgi:hypothetical protein
MQTELERARLPERARDICVVHGIPPNYAKVVAVFPEARQAGSIFTYAPKVYFTGKGELSRELKVHEHVHLVRQFEAGGPEAWWERYLVDPTFRLVEELHAHRAEWLAYQRRHGPGERYLRLVASRLAGPFYGNMVSLELARHAILTGEIPV